MKVPHKTKIAELKKRIMEKYWEEYVKTMSKDEDLEEIGMDKHKIRLFFSGTEATDDQTVGQKVNAWYRKQDDSFSCRFFHLKFCMLQHLYSVY